MSTPFDKAVAAIAQARYHNHRLESHSDTVSRGILTDLLRKCAPLRADFEKGVVKEWYNVSAPGDRRRKVDLFEVSPKGQVLNHQFFAAVKDSASGLAAKAGVVALCLLLAGCGSVSIGVSNSADWCPNAQNVPCR